MRTDSRADHELRPLIFETGYLKHPPGSALTSLGDTRVLCTVTIEEKVPPHRAASGGGWLTAEYAMLPGSTRERKKRDAGHQDGRAVEIQRLIGRSLRSVVNLDKLGPRTLHVDCDVLQADGSTRCAGITGASVALALALKHLAARGLTPEPTLLMDEMVAAVSVGLVDGRVVVDLAQSEDNRAQVDMNVVATASGRLIEVQGTAEGKPFERAQFDRLLDAALQSIARIASAQHRAVEISA